MSDLLSGRTMAAAVAGTLVWWPTATWNRTAGLVVAGITALIVGFLSVHGHRPPGRGPGGDHGWGGPGGGEPPSDRGPCHPGPSSPRDVPATIVVDDRSVPSGCVGGGDDVFAWWEQDLATNPIDQPAAAEADHSRRGAR